MKKIFLTIGVLLVSFGCVSAQNIMVGAWNIQWLGTPENRSRCNNNIRQTAEDIANYIKMSEVDILALEEISDTDGNSQTRTNQTLDDAFDLLKESDGNQWKYVLFPKRKTYQKTQLTGVAWNEKSVRMVGTPYRINMNTDANHHWNRWATAVKFELGTNKTDIVIIPVHMKANYQGNFKTQRSLEAKALINALDSVRDRFSDQDIIILGDTNILKKTEWAVWRFKNAGFIDLNKNDRPTMALGDAPFDRAFLTKGQLEFANARMDILKMEGFSKEEFSVKLSDHHMIRFPVKVLDDDD